MARLQQSAAENSPEWRALKSWCDNNLNQDLSDGYQGLGWQAYLYNYALAYRVTGNAAYGNKGVTYLKAILNDRPGGAGGGDIGNGDGGAEAIYIDAGYVSRSLGASLGVGRDWLDGAPDLTPELISEVNLRMSQWYNVVVNNIPNSNGRTVYAYDAPWDNYYAGHFYMLYAAGIGLAGDPGYDPAWLQEALNGWNNKVLPLINGMLKGGEWIEGWNYGPLASRTFMQFPLAMQTGSSYASFWGDTQWHRELVKGHLHMLHPSRNTTGDNGSWTGSSKGDPRAGTMLYLSTFAPLSQTEKGLARWYVENISDGSADYGQLWEAFLFNDDSIEPLQPTEQNVGSLAYQSAGHGYIRSDQWSSKDATFVELIGGPPNGPGGQGEMNLGEIKITGQQDLLLVDGDTWQYASDYANIMTITPMHRIKTGGSATSRWILIN